MLRCFLFVIFLLSMSIKQCGKCRNFFFFPQCIDFTSSSECCRIGNDNYQLCLEYCCDKTGLFSFYDECCSSYSRRVSFNVAETTDCEEWWAAHVWASVLVGLGSLAFLVGIIVCCVCCIKGCASSNRRTGAVVVNQGQAAPGVLMVNNSTSQQQQLQQPYAIPMQPSPAVYPPGYGGPQGYGGTGYPGQTGYPGASGVVHPPPYSGNPEGKSENPN